MRTETSLQGDKGATIRPLRLAIVGFGRLAQKYYLPALRSMKGVELVAVADPLQASQSAAKGSIPNVTAYSSHQDLLDNEAPDALLVSSPPSTHLQIWNDVCKVGMPVFMEKPFVLNEELDRVERLVQERPLLMMNFNRRFWPAFQQLGELSRSGCIGELESAEFVLNVDVMAWSSVTQHRLSPGEGGVLYDLGSQELDLITDVFHEEPRSVLAQIWSERWESDHVRLGLDFGSGMTVRCELAYTGRNQESIVIHGRQGKLRLNNPNTAIHLELNDSRRHSVIGRTRDALVFGYRALRRDRSMLRYTIRASIEAFVNALRANTPFSSGFEDAERNALWLEGASQSHSEKKPITVTYSG